MPFLTEPGVGYVAGTVTDDSLNPIEGVYVQVVELSVADSSDSDGGYILEGLENGYYDLAFSHEDFQDSIVYDIFAVIGDTAIVDITLRAWQGYEYVVGDANASGGYNGLDITYGVAYFKGGNPPPYQCDCPPHGTWYVAGDVNASCDYNGLDITYGVSYLKGIIPERFPCPDCPPGGP